MANGRIEREPQYFSGDSRLAELVNSGRPHRWYHRVDWVKLAAWLGCAIFLWVFWYGVARAI